MFFLLLYIAVVVCWAFKCFIVEGADWNNILVLIIDLNCFKCWHNIVTMKIRKKDIGLAFIYLYHEQVTLILLKYREQFCTELLMYDGGIIDFHISLTLCQISFSTYQHLYFSTCYHFMLIVKYLNLSIMINISLSYEKMLIYE